MTGTLSTRDRNLLLYALWPAALLAVLIWVVGPLAGALAAARGTVEQRQADLAVMQTAVARAGEVTGALGRLRAQDAALRTMVITAGQSVNAVVALQRLLRETGNTVLTVRVGDLERPRRTEPQGAQSPLARIPVEVTARGSYASITRFLRRWSIASSPTAPRNDIASVPLKLTKVEASHGETSGGLELVVAAAAFVPAPPEPENR